jgi:hypothetical protein
MSMVYLLLTVAGGFLGITVVSVYGIERTMFRQPERRALDRRREPEARQEERRQYAGPYNGLERRRRDRRMMDRRILDRRTAFVEREAA